MALRVPKQKKEDHFSMPTSPQNGVEHVCFMRLALLICVLANFQKSLFFYRFATFLLLYGRKTKSVYLPMKMASNKKMQTNKLALKFYFTYE